MSLLGVLRVRIVHSPIEMIKTCVDFVLDLTLAFETFENSLYEKKLQQKAFSRSKLNNKPWTFVYPENNQQKYQFKANNKKIVSARCIISPNIAKIYSASTDT